MALVRCEVSEGLRESEATVKIATLEGRSEYLPVDRGMLVVEDKADFLAVRLLYTDNGKNAALVSLPVEADSGAHRVWVRLSELKDVRKEQEHGALI